MIKPKCYAINRKKDYAEILIYGVIGIDFWTGEGNTAQGFAEEFSAIEKEFDTILVRINSPGGDIMEGLPIYNILDQSQKTINTKIDGVAASMGAIIALSGKTVSAPKTSIFMLHSASTFAMGNSKDFKEIADQLEVWDNALIAAISKKTGLTNEEVKSKWFDGKDHFLTGQEAFDAGLVDELIDSEADIPSEAKKQDASYQEILNAYRKVKPDTNFLSTLKRVAAKAFEPKQNNQTSQIGMEKETQVAINVLVGLDMNAESKQTVDAVKNLVSNSKTLNEQLEAEKKLRQTAEASNSDLQQQIEAKQTEINNLKAELGKKPADTQSVVDTNDTTVKDNKNNIVLDEINAEAQKYVTKK